MSGLSYWELYPPGWCLLARWEPDHLQVWGEVAAVVTGSHPAAAVLLQILLLTQAAITTYLYQYLAVLIIYESIYIKLYSVCE